jgi:hypothetical protein
VGFKSTLLNSTLPTCSSVSVPSQDRPPKLPQSKAECLLVHPETGSVSGKECPIPSLLRIWILFAPRLLSEELAQLDPSQKSSPIKLPSDRIISVFGYIAIRLLPGIAADVANKRAIANGRGHRSKSARPPRGVANVAACPNAVQFDSPGDARFGRVSRNRLHRLTLLYHGHERSESSGKIIHGMWSR